MSGNIKLTCSCETECQDGKTEEKTSFWKNPYIYILAVSAVLLGIGLYIEFAKLPKITAEILFLIVAVLAGHKIIKNAAVSLWNKTFDMNVLMVVAAIGAFLIGHGEEGASVLFLFGVAELLEDYAHDRARRSLSALFHLAPETALIRRKGKEETIHVHAVNIGDVAIIKPGEKVPLDGIVIKGSSTINQAAITGESMPVNKDVGSEVFAGTLNQNGYLEIRITKKSDETVVSKIISLVKEAQKKKSKSEQFIEKFAKIYTPTVISLALLIVAVPVLFFGQSLSEWLYRGLVLLVVSCPCALAISMPVSMVSALTAATRKGVLIKGSNYIEEMKKADVVVFDKTGTLTEGKFSVTDIVPINNYSESELLKIAASLESKSNHPLAEAIVDHASEKKIKLSDINKFSSLAGKGIIGTISNKKYFASSKNYGNEIKAKMPDKIISKLESEGKTCIIIGNETHLIGVIALMDKIKPEAKEVIASLKVKGIKTVMLTGDNKGTAKTVASILGLDEFHAELLPEDTVKKIEYYASTHNHVVMVGDGVNDAPALAKANVGIAMGAIGSDAAIETADIALMKDDLSKIGYLITLSKKTMSIVRQNIVLSIAVKGSLAILAFFGYITLWQAVAFGDMGLSIAVIANAIRIGSIKTEMK
ncbi:MAG: heavy metal translocating P-type ATPase [Candidatus Woesearchaeota archaeon]